MEECIQKSPHIKLGIEEKLCYEITEHSSLVKRKIKADMSIVTMTVNFQRISM